MFSNKNLFVQLKLIVMLLLDCHTKVLARIHTLLIIVNNLNIDILLLYLYNFNIDIITI